MSLQGLKALITKHEEKSSGGNFQRVRYLTLPNDKDLIVGRPLCKGIIGKDEQGEPIYDLPYYEIHEVDDSKGFKKNIKCLGEGCPLCDKDGAPRLKIFYPLFNVNRSSNDEANIYIWKRGLEDIKKILGQIEEYGDLSARDWKIVRQGKKGDTKTFYDYYPRDKEVRELPDMPTILGRYSWFVLELNANEMQEVINGTFDFDARPDNDANTPNDVTPIDNRDIGGDIPF